MRCLGTIWDPCLPYLKCREKGKREGKSIASSRRYFSDSIK